MPHRAFKALPLALAVFAATGCLGAGARVKRIVGGRTAEKPLAAGPKPEPQDEPAPAALLYSVDGRLAARVEGLTQATPPHYAFLGIRYAEPPVGRLRFQRPRKLPLEGELFAKQYGPPCVQLNPSNPYDVIGSEDCLFLNVFTPKLPPVRVSHLARRHGNCEGEDEEESPLPVMVWNHGGGYHQGSASQYGPKHLVAKGIVVVTIQYRLGPIGFLGHGDKDSPGNAALCDQLTALEWVRDYIHAFGGDGSKVSLAGHDAGASAAMILAQSQYGGGGGEGLFRSVVAMSGSSLSAWATGADPQASARRLARQLRCPVGANDTARAVRCLQEAPVRDLVVNGVGTAAVAASQFAPGDPQGELGEMFSSSAPVVDGPTDRRFLPTILEETPRKGLEAGTLPKIPLLTGITKDETSNLFSDIQKSNILKKMKEIPGYLDDVFLPQLVKSTKGLTNLTTSLTQTLSGYFGLIPGGGGGQEALGRLIEASSDALFALPVFLTSSLWKRSGGPVFLYSFDHPSPFAASVFASSPFVALGGGGGPESTKTKEVGDKSVGHGEDLFYLFEPRTVEGAEEPGLNLTKPDDLNVLDLLTSMVATFVKTGSPSIEIDGKKSEWLPFSDDQSNYLSISSKPTVGSQFKFCEMGLWSGLSSRLLSPECTAAFAPPSVLQPLSPPLQGLLGTPGQPSQGQLSHGKPPPKQGGGLSVPGLLG
ncbi:carboxylesterase 4A [Hetaerina americana]|uniref:carboxylesterase 4A n=1 Tax=Hetaerina americana TaxID=62018 RepID=UPI003A7F57DF